MLRELHKGLGRTFTRRPVVVIDACGERHAFGDPASTDAPIVLRFGDRAVEWKLAFEPRVQLGELYMDGRIVLEQGDIFDLLEEAIAGHPESLALRDVPGLAGLRRLRRDVFGGNAPRRAGRNARAHYDVDERLYRLFLDPDMQYSCAYFEQPDQDLAAAQTAKKRHLAAKLGIEPGHRVLDIGSGWGGMALYLARIAGAGEVVGVTLSPEQLRVARQRAAAAGDAPVRFELRDYRDVTDRFDRVVSVGMFEHVGRRHWRTFCEVAARLLADDGVMLLHSIVAPQGPSLPHPWIERRIFPGGHIPALSELIAAVEPSGLFVTDVELLHGHYERTLRAWRSNLVRRRREAESVAGARFVRMWEFYLAGCEAAFRAGWFAVAQVQLARRRAAVPMTRDHIAEREAMLRAREAAVEGGREAARPSQLVA